MVQHTMKRTCVFWAKNSILSALCDMSERNRDESWLWGPQIWCLIDSHLAARQWDVLAEFMWASTGCLNGVLLSCKKMGFFAFALCSSLFWTAVSPVFKSWVLCYQPHGFLSRFFCGPSIYIGVNSWGCGTKEEKMGLWRYGLCLCLVALRTVVLTTLVAIFRW